MSAAAEVPGHLLRTYKRIAVVGASGTPGKAAHDTPLYMRNRGYEIFPVNPRLDSWEGQPAYKSLADVPKPVEIVDVFRPSEEAPGVAREAAAAGAKALWLQLELKSPEAKRIAEDAGMLYVEDLCVDLEWKRIQRR